MKFLKANKLAVLSIGAIVLMMLLLLIPGFARYDYMGGAFSVKANGYEFFFNLKVHSGAIASPYGTGIVGSGIAVFVLAGLAIAMFCIAKISSFFVLLGGLFNLTNSILFFAMEASARKVYVLTDAGSICGWVTYVIAVILLAAAAYAIYKAVMMMRDEIKHPSAPKGPSYNYLKK